VIGLPVPVAVAPPGDAVATYVTAPTVPVELGEKTTVAKPSPAVTDVIVGAPGREVGVAAAAAAAAFAFAWAAS
jgi:hypothetical protein